MFNYYLINMVVNENNYLVVFGYYWKWFGLDLYYSDFDSKIGIYLGFNVGNFNDLLYLFNSFEFIVKFEFFYEICCGYQMVKYQIFKVQGYYFFWWVGKLIYIYVWQENWCLEYGEGFLYNQQIVDVNILDVYF